jgi:hypothetical protein
VNRRHVVRATELLAAVWLVVLLGLRLGAPWAACETEVLIASLPVAALCHAARRTNPARSPSRSSPNVK